MNFSNLLSAAQDPLLGLVVPLHLLGVVCIAKVTSVNGVVSLVKRVSPL